MPQQAYEPCQPNEWYDTDDFHDWLAELYATRLAHATDGGLAMAIATRTNPLDGQPLGLVWDTFYADLT